MSTLISVISTFGKVTVIALVVVVYGDLDVVDYNAGFYPGFVGNVIIRLFIIFSIAHGCDAVVYGSKC